MKTYKKILFRIFLLAIIFSSFASNVSADPCSNCNEALVMQNIVLVGNLRTNIGMITPFVGSQSNSFIGGSWDNTFSQWITSFGAIMGTWELQNMSLQTGVYAQLVFANLLISSTGQYWEQIYNVENQFQRRMNELDNDYCKCLMDRSCATSCNFFYH